MADRSRVGQGPGGAGAGTPPGRLAPARSTGERTSMSVHLDAAAHRRVPGTPEQAPRPDRSRGRRSTLTWLDMKGSPYLYVAPFFVIFAVFMVYPLVYTLYVSTRKWQLGAQESTSVGFGN